MLAPLMCGITVKGTFVIELPSIGMMKEGDGEIWTSAPFKIERRAEGGKPVYEVQQIGRAIQRGNQRRSMWRNV